MKNRCFISLLAAAATPFAAVAGQTAFPHPPKSFVVIGSNIGRSNEPSIAVDPNDPSHVVVTWQNQAHVAYSTDSGKTFTTAEGTAPTDWRTSGDVSITYDNKGHAILGYLAFDRLGPTSGYWARGAGRNGIFTRRSLDGGKTWEKEASSIKSWPTGKEPGLEWEDMPRVFADNGPKSPHAGNLYAGWIEWQIQYSVMLFSRSTDDGKTWQTPIKISTKPGLPRDGIGGLVGFVGATSAQGELYGVWNDGHSIVLAHSKDGGKTFEPSRSVIETGPPSVPGGSGLPQIGVDQRTGRVYVSWCDVRNGDGDVFVASSGDHGRTWSKPVRVNTDELHNGIDQFFQWMAIDPVSGAVNVQFYDRREDAQNVHTRMALARSTDGGKAFVNYAWGDTQFDARAAGDYTWLTAYDDRVYGAWTEPAPTDSTAPAPPSGRAGRGNAGGGGGATLIRVGVADFKASR